MGEKKRTGSIGQYSNSTTSVRDIYKTYIVEEIYPKVSTSTAYKTFFATMRLHATGRKAGMRNFVVFGVYKAIADMKLSVYVGSQKEI